MESIILRIEELAKKNSLTGRELGKKLGLKKSPLTDWKNGKAKPTLEQAIKMCDIFAVSANELLGISFTTNLTSEEQQLINYFRNCNQDNKKVILNAAKQLQEQDRETLSISKIG